MDTYRPFIDDPQALVRYAGQRYVVLRVVGDAAMCFENVHAQLRAKLGDPSVTFPAVPHLTGYRSGTEVAQLARVVAAWAAMIQPLVVEVGESVSWFPPPFQVIVLPVRRTEALFGALVAIREAGARAGFPLATVTPPQNWTFHLTLASSEGLESTACAEAQRMLGGATFEALRVRS